MGLSAAYWLQKPRKRLTLFRDVRISYVTYMHLSVTYGIVDLLTRFDFVTDKLVLCTNRNL